MNTEALMSCPFCGAAEDDLHIIEIDSAQWAVDCKSCGAVGPNDWDQARAAQLWNGSALHALGRVRIPAEGAVMLTRAGRVAA